MKNNSSAVSILLKEINELKDKVRELEKYIWMHNTVESITSEIVEWPVPLGSYSWPSYIPTRYDTYIDYNHIVNAPNAVTNISTQPNALIVEYSNWQRSFVPLCITSRNGWYNI